VPGSCLWNRKKRLAINCQISGKGKGVTVKSFIDESFRLFFSTVFSSSEREAAYVFDGVLHNEVVKSDIHSTDTHGYSEAIFGTVYLLGLVFAPRIKGVQDQQLYSFEKRKVYEGEGFKILPQKYVNTELIAEHWDELLRLIATMKLKETTASQLFSISSIIRGETKSLGCC
jgi:TnpA family transposase